MPPNIMNNNNLVLAHDPAWHRLGTVIQTPMGAVEAFSIMEGYSLEKRPVKLFMNGDWEEQKDFAIIRSPVPSDPREVKFGYVTKGYQIIQPLRICELFDENVQAPVETIGALGKGERLFVTWELPSFTVGEDDHVKTYGFCACGYDGKMGASLYLTTVRVVCGNTFNMAISEATNSNHAEGKGKVWSGKHNSQNIERDLGIWFEHTQEKALGHLDRAAMQFNEMAKVAIQEKETVYDLLFKVYPDPKPVPDDYPIKLRAERQEKIDKEAAKAKNDRDAAFALYDGSAGIAIDPNLWGVLNSVTQLENYRDSKKSPEVSILFGDRAKAMEKAYNVITDYMIDLKK